MTKLKTSDAGIRAVVDAIRSRGGSQVKVEKEGNKTFIRFRSPNGRALTAISRAKRAGTWQTVTTYGKSQNEKPSEDHFWIFVDLGSAPPKFYPVPLWWISNDIFRAHMAYLKVHGGKRAVNDESKHHAVSLKRIAQWEGRWEILGL